MTEIITSSLLNSISQALSVFIPSVTEPPPSIVNELVVNLKAYRDEFEKKVNNHFSKDYAKHLQAIMNLGLNDPTLTTIANDYKDEQGIPMFDISLVMKICNNIRNIGINFKRDYDNGCLTKEVYSEIENILQSALEETRRE